MWAKNCCNCGCNAVAGVVLPSWLVVVLVEADVCVRRTPRWRLLSKGVLLCAVVVVGAVVVVVVVVVVAVVVVEAVVVGVVGDLRLS